MFRVVIMVNRMREDDELPGEVADIAVDSAKVHPRVTNIPIKTKAKAEVNGVSNNAIQLQIFT